jgi:hypothetical protein
MNIQKIHPNLYEDTKLERISICSKPCPYIEVHYEFLSAKLCTAIYSTAIYCACWLVHAEIHELYLLTGVNYSDHF